MNCAEDSQEFADVMTDVDGNKHRITLPSGKVDPKKWAKLTAHAHEVLPPPFAEMVQKTSNPFISSINDFDISKPSFFDGKLLFVGDALATFRPHVASSTHQASIDAALLERLMKGEITTQQWEEKVLAFARATTARSNLWGAYYMSGLPTLTFASALLELGKIMAVQWFQKRWYGES
jgi:2-polyprenyl-6-methoxyphenol hydroxylase-like FAD-dependent oxidoreductase